METLTITLAGKDYQIQPFTVGQLEELHVGVVRAQDEKPEEGVRDFWKQNVEVLHEALKIDHPEMTVEVIRKLRLGSIKEVKAQVAAILDFAGIVEKAPAATNGAEKPSGEAGASAA